MREVIERLAADPRNPSASSIRRMLERQFDPSAVPSDRTIRAIVASVRDVAPDASLWRLADADPDEAALVLPVLGELLTVTDWREQSLSRSEAAWIARLRRAVPDLPLVDVIRYARRYVARGDAPSTDLDRALASGSWRSLENALAAHYGEQQEVDRDEA